MYWYRYGTSTVMLQLVRIRTIFPFTFEMEEIDKQLRESCAVQVPYRYVRTFDFRTNSIHVAAK